MVSRDRRTVCVRDPIVGAFPLSRSYLRISVVLITCTYTMTRSSIDRIILSYYAKSVHLLVKCLPSACHITPFESVSASLTACCQDHCRPTYLNFGERESFSKDSRLSLSTHELGYMCIPVHLVALVTGLSMDSRLSP